MSENLTPHNREKLSQLELDIRSCCQALSSASSSERQDIHARLIELNQELEIALQNMPPTEVKQSRSSRPSEEVTVRLTPNSASDSSASSLSPIERCIAADPEDPTKTSPTNESVTIVFDTANGKNVDTRDLRESNHDIFGDYEIIREIARGGMGVVYKARQISLNRIVALKKVLSGQLAGQADIERFRNEAESSANLNHSGIVPVYDFGEVDGQYYFSMGYIEGSSLAEQIAENPLECRDAVKLLIKISRAVGHANRSGIIHRDLKPANILLDKDGEPKVTDFGLAKRESDDSGLTAAGMILGTPSYMSPEQVLGKAERVDQRSDVYSLGATLYDALTGRPPFHSANTAETILQVLEKEPVPPKQLVDTLPRDVETVCLKALRKEADKRYRSADDFADDLQRWLSGEPILARPVGQMERVWKWCKRKPIFVISLASLALLLIVGIVVLWERQNSTYANGLVEQLRSASADEVGQVVQEIPDYGYWISDELTQRFHMDSQSPKEKLHLALGLIAFDSSVTEYLRDRLLSLDESEFEYVAVISDSLSRYDSSTSDTLWETFQNQNIGPAKRFRAGLSLAHLVGDSDKWKPEDETLLVDHLVATNAVYQPDLWPLLEPIKSRLLDRLDWHFRSKQSSEIEKLAAANAIGYFAEDDAELLSQLLLPANGQQYRVLFDKFKRSADPSTLEQFTKTIYQQPERNLAPSENVALGKDRATSAITLLLQGKQDPILDVLRYETNPEALTQFVHRCKERGVTPSVLIDLLERVDQERGPLTGDRQKQDESVMYALLLALGEFDWDELSSTQQEIAQRLELIYEKDPSSCIHSATGWLLRKWKQKKVVNRVDQTPLEYDPTGVREWFVREIAVPTARNASSSTEQKIHLTFIVFQPGTFTMGSDDSVLNFDKKETQHKVQFSQSLAVCDRELTWEQWGMFEGPRRRSSFAKQFSQTLNDRDPVFGIKWFDTVSYCRWLSQRAGIAESDQAYLNPSSLSKNDKGFPVNWPMKRTATGFRLPTEAEWEYVCRSGTSTSFSFGDDEEMLSHYGWQLDNSNDWSQTTAQLRPNPRGLFDIHGNLTEWCHDWFNDGVLVDDVDPTGSDTGRFRVSRGGAWNTTPGYCRSAIRDAIGPDYQVHSQGFRLVFTLGELE